MYLHIREITKVFLGSFHKANTVNTKKPLKLFQTIVNYSKNEQIKKSKAKGLLPEEFDFINIMKSDPQLHE